MDMCECVILKQLPILVGRKTSLPFNENGKNENFKIDESLKGDMGCKKVVD